MNSVPHNHLNALQKFTTGFGNTAFYYSLPQLESKGVGAISRLPMCLRVILESVLRNMDGSKITEDHVTRLARWQPYAPRKDEIPFMVSRILLQDFTGVPLLVDLAAMRDAAKAMGINADRIEPLVPVDLVIDHSIQVDYYNTPDAARLNMEMEFQRNHERYRFLKWGAQSFSSFHVLPPGTGIVHQINLEYLARGVTEKNGIYCPDTVVGTDSHTTMINGLGILGWGVGGIEAEAGILGQPVYLLTPDVVGLHLHGRLSKGVTATDLVLHITELLRKAKVVGKFVEFHGTGAASLSLPDRATVANMAPEYGATIGFFATDEVTLAYYRTTGRSTEHVQTIKNYFQAQNMFGIPRHGECDYSKELELDLTEVVACVAGPKRPQDRIALTSLRHEFRQLLVKAAAQGGYGKLPGEINQPYPIHPSGKKSANNRALELRDGSVVIAAITSCTNTSNPGALLAAGLLAKKAVALGLKAQPWTKTSLAPGSRAVTLYLQNAGLLEKLAQLGFHIVGYGCTTCIGNSGPLLPEIDRAVHDHDIVAVSVLSGNRNFEARVHPSVKANFLASPPLVVAFAIAGKIDIDFTTEPLGMGQDGQPVYLKDIWPTTDEINQALHFASDPALYRATYHEKLNNMLWDAIPVPASKRYPWDKKSTYIQPPPFFSARHTDEIRNIVGARALCILGDSVTTDHISPAGSIKPSSPAGEYLRQQGVDASDFNSYGARRGNHEVMVRGTFANIRIKNLMVPGTEGGITLHYPHREKMSIFAAAMKYKAENVPLIVFAGEEYGSGSSRDWAAKGPQLLGVKAVVAKSYERIHRSNLVGMGILPCEFLNGENAQSLNLDGSESFDLTGLTDGLQPNQELTLTLHRKDSSMQTTRVRLRIDSPMELGYYRHGGILPYVLGQMAGRAN